MIRLRRARRGSAATEFALLVPVVFGILTITVDMGWYLWRHADVVEAAREGARHGGAMIENPAGTAVPTEADIENDAVAHTRAVLGAQGAPCESGCTVAADTHVDAGSGYRLLTVSVTYPYNPIIGVWERLQGPVQASFTVMTASQP